MPERTPPTALQARALERASRQIDRLSEVGFDESAGLLTLRMGGLDFVIATREEADGVEAALELATDLDDVVGRMPELSAMEGTYEAPEGLSPVTLADAVLRKLSRDGDVEIRGDRGAVRDTVARILDRIRHRSCGPALLEALSRSPDIGAVNVPQAKLRRVVQDCATELRDGVEPSTRLGWQ